MNFKKWLNGRNKVAAISFLFGIAFACLSFLPLLTFHTSVTHRSHTLQSKIMESNKPSPSKKSDASDGLDSNGHGRPAIKQSAEGLQARDKRRQTVDDGPATAATGSSDTQASVVGMSTDEIILQALAQPDVWRVGTEDEYFRYRPPLESFEPPSLQVENWLFYFGGFNGGLDTVNRQIQILNIATDKWEPPVSIPDGLAETHQGVAFDPEDRFIYAISGQIGGGCGPPTPKSFRVHVDSREVQEIPAIPAGRYNPGVAVVDDRVHVFGGSNELRNMSALEHWVLPLSEWMPEMGTAPQNSLWKRLDDLPVSGCHGESFRFANYIYHFGGCYMDQGVSGGVKACHADAAANGMYVHHVPVAASAYRFNLMVKGAVWEKIPDMPHSVCISPALLVGQHAIFFGGGGAERQGVKGTPPRSEGVVQALDMQRLRWLELAPLPVDQGPLFHLSVWQAQKGDRFFFHAIRPAEYHPAGRKVERSTYLVAEVSSTEVPAASNQIQKLRDKAKAASDPQAWGSYEVVQEGFLACMFKEGDGISVVTRKDGEEVYDNARTSRNGAYHGLQFPLAVVSPISAEDVATTVKCAVGAGMQVCGRNGKHSFEGLGCTNGVVIDVTLMNRITTLEPSDGKTVTAQLGAGLMLGQVAHKCIRRSMWLPAGVCPTVGVTGLVLVGGQGMLSRLFGLLADRLLGLEMVTAEGKVVEASAEKHKELLWLAKGGGSYEHFPGVITSLRFSLFPMKPQEKQWVKFSAEILNPRELAHQTFMHWQRWAPDHPDRRLTAELWVSKQWDGEARLYYTGLFFGPVEKFEALWKEEVESHVPSELKYSAMDASEYIIKATGVDEEEELLTGKHGWDASGALWKGRSFVSKGTMLNSSSFQALANHVWDADGRQYVELKPLGGAIAEIEPADTAFWHRKASWWGLYQSFWPEDWGPEQIKAMLGGGAAVTQGIVEGLRAENIYGGQYVGYVDHSGAKNRGEELRSYYGGNLQRIQNVRRRWDPSGVFRHVRPKVNLLSKPKKPKLASAKDDDEHDEEEEDAAVTAAARKRGRGGKGGNKVYSARKDEGAEEEGRKGGSAVPRGSREWSSRERQGGGYADAYWRQRSQAKPRNSDDMHQRMHSDWKPRKAANAPHARRTQGSPP